MRQRYNSIAALGRRAQHHARMAASWERLADEAQRRQMPASVIALCRKKAATSCRCIERVTDRLQSLVVDEALAAVERAKGGQSE